MRKKVVLVVAGMVVAVAVGGGYYFTRANQSQNSQAQLVQLDPNFAGLWPLNRTWIWDVDPIATKRKVTVVVRTVEERLPAGETNPSIPVSPELPERGKDVRWGWSVVGSRRIPGRVFCQLIDLREIGLGNTAGETPMRLLVREHSGGGRSGTPGEQSFLLGDRICGTSADNHPKWIGDQMLLLTIHTIKDDLLYTHFVFIEQSDQP